MKISAMLVLLAASGNMLLPQVRVTVNAAKVRNTMKGGIGASWHAIESPIPWADHEDPVFGSKSQGGSGWGAYPAAEDDAAWRQIDRHARWLGLDWNRVELEQRIYEPQRGKYTWNSPEMRVLYRILDWCQRNKSDVFLQQMWSNVAWNTYPEWRDTASGRVHSAPVSVEDFADGLASLAHQLVHEKGYTCIRWLAITNEPAQRFSWFQMPPNKPATLGPAFAAVRNALDGRGLTSLPLSGPDYSYLPEFNPHLIDFGEFLGAYDFHSYGADWDWRKQGSLTHFEASLARWIGWAHAQSKPLFLSELGTMANGWGGNSPAPGSYNSLLKDAELMIRSIAQGVDGMNRWSFLNRGDLDGQWQLLDTWDPAAGSMLQEYMPHPNSYYIYGLMSRFIAKHSSIVASAVDGGESEGWQRVFVAALRSPAGRLTLAVVNDSSHPFDAAFELRGLPAGTHLYRYGITEAEKDRTDLRIDPQREILTTSLTDTLAPMSLTIYSMYKLAHGEPGVISDAREQ